jgi:alpha-1,2-mannosyltransferase
MSTPAFAASRPARPAETNRARALERLLLPAALLTLAVMVWHVLRGNWAGFDFQYAYWRAGQRVILGTSPYAWTQAQVINKIIFVYPALSAVLFAPLSLIPRVAGADLAMLLCVALVPATLRLLGVRDRGVYAITLLWLPVYAAWQTANETMFLVFGLACVWRWRDRPLVAGLLTGAMISLKPLLWPLVLWLLVTRRWRASASALISGLLFNLAAWSVVGFGQITRYLNAASADTTAAWRTGWGVPALLGHLGMNFTAGLVAMLIVSVALAGALIYVGFVRRDELRALTLMVALALISSPLLWSHYLALLIVPLALMRPRLHWVWLMPVLMWVSPLGMTVHAWQLLVSWAAAGAMFLVLLRRSEWPHGRRTA